MTCTYPPSVYPPPCTPPCIVPPPAGGDACNRVSYTCDCTSGTPVWVLGTNVCVPNAECSGLVSCLPTAFSMEVINGCAAGVPLASYDPTSVTPACEPDCCNTKKCKYRWTTTCSLGVWGPAIPADTDCISGCVDTADNWVPINGDACKLEYIRCLNSCVSVGACVPLAAPATPLGPVPNCCQSDPAAVKRCAFQFSAACSQGVWSVTRGILQGFCLTDCQQDDSWVFSDSCHASRLLCANACVDSGWCSSAATPPAPSSTPSCCLARNCAYQWTAACSLGAWSVTPGVLQGFCLNDCVASGGWVFSDACHAYQLTCGASCIPSDTCASGTPPSAPGGATPGCCGTSPTFCNCVYTSLWDCNSSTWSSPTLQVCTTDATSHASPWGYLSTCGAQTTVSVAGTCG